MSARKAWKHKPKNQKVESEIPDTFNGSLSDVTEFPSLTKLIPKSTNQLDSKKIGEPKKVNEPKVSLETQLTQANGFKVVVTKITIDLFSMMFFDIDCCFLTRLSNETNNV